MLNGSYKGSQFLGYALEFGDTVVSKADFVVHAVSLECIGSAI